MLETFDDGRRVYMILDYQENGDVLRYIQKVGALNEPLAQSWTWQVDLNRQWCREERLCFSLFLPPHKNWGVEYILLNVIQ